MPIEDSKIFSQTPNAAQFESTIEQSTYLHAYNQGQQVGSFLAQHYILLDAYSKSQQDPLTLLPNQRYVERELQYRVSSLRSEMENDRHTTGLCYVLADVDNLKQINDNFGHDNGNKALRAVADALRDRVKRAEDTVARLHGDEFAVITVGASANDIKDLLSEVKPKVVLHHNPEDGGHLEEIDVTLSIGIARVIPGETANSAARRADKALYEAKANGRNTIVISEQYTLPRD